MSETNSHGNGVLPPTASSTTAQSQGPQNVFEPISPTRRLGASTDQALLSEESADIKRYEQLLKICSQMKDKEAELNQKEEKLRNLNARKQELDRTLSETKSRASKTAPAEKNQRALQIEQSISDKNTLIQVIENELTELSTEQKARVSSDEAVISGYIKKVMGVESEITRAQKQSALATNKLLELQTKVLNEAPKAENQQIKDLNENLQKRKAELTVARDTQKELQGHVDARIKSSGSANQQMESLRTTVKELESSISKLKENVVVKEKLKEIDSVKSKTEAQLRAKLREVEERIVAPSLEGVSSSKKVGELKQKLTQVQKELDTLRASEQEDSQTLTNNTQQIQKQKQEKKKDQDGQKSQDQKDQSRIKELHKAIDALKKQEKTLKQEEVELQRSNHVQELEDMKKKAHKRQGEAEAIDALRVTKSKLDRELHDAKQRYSNAEKQQKSHVPSQLIEEYKKKIEEKKGELVVLDKLSEENVGLKKRLNEMIVEKDKIEWDANPRIDELHKEIKMGKLRIEDVTQQNKDVTKRVAQVTSKLNEYVKAYPDFQIPKKGKKGGIEAKESKKEEKKQNGKQEAKAAAKAEPKVEAKAEPQKKAATKGSKKKKGGASQQQQGPIQIQVIEEIYIIEQPLEPIVAAQPPAQKKGKKKNKGADRQAEEKPRQQASQPEESEKLAEIQRKIIQQATKEAVDEQRAEEQAKKTSKKDRKKGKGAREARRETPEQTEEEFVNSLPTAKEDTLDGGLKNLLLPGAVLVVLGLVFLMLR